MTARERLTPKEIQIAILVWEGLTNREIGRIIGSAEQVIKITSAAHLGKLGLEPPGTGHVCRQPRR